MALTVVWKLSYAMKAGLLPIQREICGLAESFARRIPQLQPSAVRHGIKRQQFPRFDVSGGPGVDFGTHNNVDAGHTDSNTKWGLPMPVTAPATESAMTGRRR